jgi:hypothetical protein
MKKILDQEEIDKLTRAAQLRNHYFRIQSPLFSMNRNAYRG